MTVGKPMGPLALANMRAAQQKRRLRECPGHWAVTVSRSGDEIITIESNCLSGREISAADEQTIRTAARHLLSFIGDRP